MSKPLTAPTAAVRPFEITTHGHSRVDNYYWMRQREDPEVIAYLEAENQYAQGMLAHTEELQNQLYQEMVDRIQETDVTAPVKHGEYYYYSRTEAGKQYDIHCRKAGSLEAPEQLLVDMNQLAEQYDYLEMGIFEVSPDHKVLAYSLDTDGAENFIIFFKDLESGELLPDQITAPTTYQGEWANDNKTLFYTTQDYAKRSYKCFRHTLGTDPASDTLVYHEPDELYRVALEKTKDQRFIIINIHSMESSENRFLDADTPEGEFRTVHPRQARMLYQLDHRQGMFYIVTNDQATNFRLMTAPVSDYAKSSWQELIPHRQDVRLDQVELFANHMVRYERENGLRTIAITRFSDQQTHYVSFPEPIYSFEEGDNPDYESALLRFVYTSLTTPESDFDYHMDSRERQLIKQQPVLGGYDPADYQSERLFAAADDGTQVPISIVYRKGMSKDGGAPCLLYGYGSYGASIDPSFNAIRLSLIDRGFIFAIAHIRGGEEMGRHWYDQGKFLNKVNTFTDFIASAKHLIALRYTAAEKLAVMGRSAGGLLMGAVVTMAPELFKAVVAGVPFVDVVTTMLDESIPLTVGEFEEWGNPQDPEYYRYMLSYSPYDNVDAKAYPNMLVTAGLNDPRVQYWEPAKWVAKIRAAAKGDPSEGANRLFLKTFMGAGHFSSSGRYDYLKDIAFEYAFILDTLGFTR